MEYFNHFTVNTGHNRKTYASEMDVETIMNFKPMVDKIIRSKEKYEFIIDGTYIDIVKEEDMYIASLYVESYGQIVPVFSSVATSNEGKRKEVEETISKLRPWLNEDVSYILPSAPLIADVIFPTCNLCPELFKETGDLSRCLAWTILSPGSVIFEWK